MAWNENILVYRVTINRDDNIDVALFGVEVAIGKEMQEVIKIIDEYYTPKDLSFNPGIIEKVEFMGNLIMKVDKSSKK